MNIVERIEKSLNPHLKRLEEFKLFETRLEFLGRISHMFKVQSLQKGDIIIEEGRRVDRICWILSGKVRVTRIVPFVQIAGTNVLKGHQLGTALVDNEKLVEYNLECQVLEESDWFPGLHYESNNGHNLKYDGFNAAQKKQLVDRYLVPGVTSEVSFSCLEASMICSAPITDFLSVCHSDLLLELLSKPCFADYPLAALQQTFVDQKLWATQKKHIAEDYRI